MENNDRKPRYKKPKFNRGDNRQPKKPEGDVVVYRTKPTGPEKPADWQLKLMAISDCYDKQDQENYKELVEARYQELLHRK